MPENTATKEKVRKLTVGEDTLLHGEALLVVSAGNAEHVALPFVAQNVNINFSAHTLFIENTQFVVIDHLKSFLSSRCGVGNVQLKLDDKKINHEYSAIECKNHVAT